MPMKPYPACKRLDGLPPDIFLGEIFTYLGIEDIFRMRRVSKHFNALTREPIIWKSFLRRLHIPLAPIRPNYRHSSDQHAYEAEQLITRAITLDDNWRQRVPKITSYDFLSVDQEVYELKLLPGGRYLAASVKCGQAYYVTLTCLGHPQLAHRGPLVRVPTFFKAYDLQAKYMNRNGYPVIVIMFLTRRWAKNNTNTSGLDPSLYANRSRIEPPFPMKWHCISWMAPLAILDQIPHHSPGSDFMKELFTIPPFTLLMDYQSDTPLECPSLYMRDYTEANGEVAKYGLYGAVIKKGNRENDWQDSIVTMKLQSKETSSLYPNPSPEHEYQGLRHQTLTYRVLPEQGDILMVRSVGTSPLALPTTADPATNIFLYIIEIFPLAEKWGTLGVRANYKDRVFLEDKICDSFHINDEQTEFGEDHPILLPQWPPPFSVYGRTVGDGQTGIVHVNISPEPIGGGPQPDHPGDVKFHYNLNYAVVQSRTIRDNMNHYVIPGQFRSFLYAVDRNDRSDAPKLLRMRKYLNPDWKPDDYQWLQRPKNREHCLTAPRTRLPKFLFSDIQLPEEIHKELAKGGIAAISYDEGIGRIVVTSGKDRRKITVLDLSHVVHLEKPVPSVPVEEFEEKEEVAEVEKPNVEVEGDIDMAEESSGSSGSGSSMDEDSEGSASDSSMDEDSSGDSSSNNSMDEDDSQDDLELDDTSSEYEVMEEVFDWADKENISPNDSGVFV